MGLKTLSSLVFLLLLPTTVHLQPCLADEGSVPVPGASQPGVSGSSKVNVQIGANWDHDLFAIFREGPVVAPELGKNALVVAAPKKAAAPRELKLKGIVLADDGHASALVDGKIVRPGEGVDGWRVSRITRHSLLLEDPAGRREYELLAGSELAMVRSWASVAPE